MQTGMKKDLFSYCSRKSALFSDSTQSQRQLGDNNSFLQPQTLSQMKQLHHLNKSKNLEKSMHIHLFLQYFTERGLQCRYNGRGIKNNREQRQRRPQQKHYIFLQDRNIT
ncbi:endothelial protein C receptor [Platysternon megacephalum]|uniref:Endothelial protein C receptor n=1 Tax=Platysternon megacephalum TaxID=55544 RepID=A0A4D9EX24_9SAUR|nr:endothelial protein C receptor [Platysternon megacephalum]